MLSLLHPEGGYPPLSFEGIISIIVCCGLTVHWIFKRWEPSNPIVHIGLLGLFPTLLSRFLAKHGANQSVLSSTAVAFGTYHLTLCLSILAYRLSPWHPLAQYPGPLICRTTRVWMAIISLGGKQHVYIQNLHNRYGDIVRMGPNEVSIRDVSAINPMMGSQGMPKGPNWGGRTLHNPVRSVIGISDPIIHLQHRKAWNRAFSTAALEEFQVQRLPSRIREFIKAALNQQKQHGSVEIHQLICYFTYDTMCDVVFGGGSEMMRDGDPAEILKNLEQGMKAALFFDHIPWFAHYFKWLAPGSGYMTFCRLAAERTKARQLDGATSKDLFYYLTREDTGEEPPSEAQLIQDGLLAIIAGSDTTSGVLTIIFYFLTRYPEVQSRLQEEIDLYYAAIDDSLDTIHYHKMAYLDAVINETQRMYGAVMSGSQRAPVKGSGGKAVGPYYIPEGTAARIHFYSVQHDPRNFTNPDRFWPERWLLAEGFESAVPDFVHDPNAFLPFSHGPANCAGKNLAMMEMRMLVCHTFHRFRTRFVDPGMGGSWEMEIEDRFIVASGPLSIILESRF